LQGFILIWIITFWHELFFWIANQLHHCDCIIGMHTLIHVRNIFLNSEFSNPTFDYTCLFYLCYVITLCFILVSFFIKQQWVL
jgi:hypothetical protein